MAGKKEELEFWSGFDSSVLLPIPFCGAENL